MNLLENVASSISGSVDKAILCIKKPISNNNNNTGINVSASKSTINLQAQLTALKKNGMFSFGTQAEEKAKANGYHVLKVKYNPSKISFSSRAGSFIQPGPGGEATNTLSQVVVPAETYMNFELLFDKENHQDAFMFDKFTNLSTGAIVSDAAGIVKDGGYSVKEEVEAMIGMMTQSETREVVFYWSEMVFAGEIVSLDARYTMFSPSGNPIRAVVRVTLRESAHSGTSGAYWNEAFNKLGQQGSKLDKATNLLNFK